MSRISPFQPFFWSELFKPSVLLCRCLLIDLEVRSLLIVLYLVCYPPIPEDQPSCRRGVNISESLRMLTPHYQPIRMLTYP